MAGSRLRKRRSCATTVAFVSLRPRISSVEVLSARAILGEQRAREPQDAALVAREHRLVHAELRGQGLLVEPAGEPRLFQSSPDARVLAGRGMRAAFRHASPCLRFQYTSGPPIGIDCNC